MDWRQEGKLISVAQCVQFSSVAFISGGASLQDNCPHCWRNGNIIKEASGLFSVHFLPPVNLRYKLGMQMQMKVCCATLTAACSLIGFYSHIKTRIETGKWPKSQMIPWRCLKRAEKWFNFTFPITTNPAQWENSGYFNYGLHRPLQLSTRCKYVAN